MEVNLAKEIESAQKELQQMQSQLMGIEQARQELVNKIIKKSGELELLQRLGEKGEEKK